MTSPAFRPTCVPLEDRTTPTAIPSLATGAVAGQPPEVRAYDSDGAELTRFLAYAADFTGGVNVALGDVTGDNVPDIVTAPKAGGGSNVRVFDGSNFSLVRSFYAFDPTFTGGASLAVADIVGDRNGDLIVGAGAGGGPQVVVFDGATGELAKSFYAFEASFTGGVSVAAQPQLITTTVYGPEWVTDPNAPPPDPQPGTPSSGIRIEGNAVLVSRPPTTVRTSGTVIAGAGPSGGPQVTVFDVDTLAVKSSFYAYDPSFRGGVAVTSLGWNGLLTAAGEGGASHIKGFTTPSSIGGAPTVETQRVNIYTGASTDTHGVLAGSSPSMAVTATRRPDGRVEVKRFAISYLATGDGGSAEAFTEYAFDQVLDFGPVGSIAVSPSATIPALTPVPVE